MIRPLYLVLIKGRTGGSVLCKGVAGLAGRSLYPAQWGGGGGPPPSALTFSLCVLCLPVGRL
jgi:hypothetical protein